MALKVKCFAEIVLTIGSFGKDRVAQEVRLRVILLANNLVILVVLGFGPFPSTVSATAEGKGVMIEGHRLASGLIFLAR